MRRVLWTPAGLDEVCKMASSVRAADKREWETVTGSKDMRSQMAKAHAGARISFVGRDFDNVTDDPYVYYGVTDLPATPEWGSIWLVATPRVRLFKGSVRRSAPERIQWIHDRGWYPKGLHNVVDTRNKKHLKWLTEIGAEFPAGNDRMVRGVLFRYFRFTNVRSN